MALRRFRFVLWLAVGLAGAACERNATRSSSGGPGTSAATSGSASASVAGGVDAASPNDVEAAQQAAEDESVRYELESQHRHHHRGFAGLVFMAVETLGIAPDQQVAVDKIRKELYANMRPIREANGSLLRVLGDGVATGTIDKAKVDAADAYIKAFDTAFVEDTFDAKKLPASATDNTHVVAWGAERMARFYEALVPVLTPAQRTKVADELHQRAADSTPKEKS
jgi:Spy/CpxP family protein refolding chaperone